MKSELDKSEQSALAAKQKFELALKSHDVSDTESARKNLKAIDSRLKDYDVAARTVEGEVLSSREEAEKVNAMPEFRELGESWEKYKTDRTDGALSHIAALLQKMPQKIRETYWEQLSAFEVEQKEIPGREKIRISTTFVLCYVAAIVGLIFFARDWQGWEWLGLKGAATAFMFIVPTIGLSKILGGSSTDENPNPSLNFHRGLVWLYWEAALLTLTIPSWDSYSRFWQILLAIVGLIIGVIIVTSFGEAKNNKKKVVEKAAKSVGYLSDFEKLSSQSEEYRAFKAARTK